MANWRDTYRPARFFLVDARILFLVLPMLLHLRWYTVAPTIGAVAFLYYFEKRRDMDVPSSLRMLRSWLCGPLRPARARAKIRRPVDYDRGGR